jgi:hypothetical protein|nr:MAG TPA: type I neck protein [Caudoviricetes sp.]
MGADFSELIAFRDKLQASIDDTQVFLESCVKELAARLLADVIKNTEPGIYPPSTGKVGGTLRRGWTAGQEIDARQYVKSIVVTRVGNNFVIELINPVEYAMYVEYGHRTSNHKGWVDGKFTLTIAEKDIQMKAPAILEKKLEKYLREVFKSD